MKKILSKMLLLLILCMVLVSCANSYINVDIEDLRNNDCISIEQYNILKELPLEKTILFNKYTVASEIKENLEDVVDYLLFNNTKNVIVKEIDASQSIKIENTNPNKKANKDLPNVIYINKKTKINNTYNEYDDLFYRYFDVFSSDIMKIYKKKMKAVFLYNNEKSMCRTLESNTLLGKKNYIEYVFVYKGKKYSVYHIIVEANSSIFFDIFYKDTNE